MNYPVYGIGFRRYETKLGSWVTDLMLKAFEQDKAQIDLMNAGGLRLNQDIPEGAALDQRIVEELFAYPTPLKGKKKASKTEGIDLKQVVLDRLDKLGARGSLAPAFQGRICSSDRPSCPLSPNDYMKFAS